MRRLPGHVSFRLVAGTARVAPARRPGERRQAVHLRAMRPTLPLPFRLREASGAESSRPPPRRQAVHLRRLRDAVQVSQVVQEAQVEPRVGAVATRPGIPERGDRFRRVLGRRREERPGVEHG